MLRPGYKIESFGAKLFSIFLISRVVKFIIPETVDGIESRKDEIASLVETITGGDAEIQDVQPFAGQEDTLGTLDINRRSGRDDTDHK